MRLDLDQIRAELQGWIGRQERAEDLVTAAPVAMLSATLDRDDPQPRPGDELPPLWHWLYFLPVHRQAELGADGHAKLGGFLPPVPLPSRMWAGSRLEFVRPLKIGEEIHRTSRIHDIQCKQGRSGPLVFVVVRHEIGSAEGPAILEEHDIVYRDHPKPGQSNAEPPAAPPGGKWSREIQPTDVLLFRYSALTFNGHRIHYDRRYCTEVEHYPGLVVHGPLIATMLLDLLRRHAPDARVRKFSFRAVSPVFDTAAFSVRGEPDESNVRLWAATSTGAVAMEATATLA